MFDECAPEQEMVWLPEQLVRVSGGALVPLCLLQAAHLLLVSLSPHPSPEPRCRRLSRGVSSPLSVLLGLGDDRLWTERFLQLPGLARRRQQCGHQSDGWRLCLNHLTKARRGAEGCSRVTCRVALRVSPEGTTLAPV